MDRMVAHAELFVCCLHKVRGLSLKNKVRWAVLEHCFLSQNYAIKCNTRSFLRQLPITLITARIVEVRKLIATTRNQTPGQELQPKEVIASNAQVREYLRQLNEDYKELERLFSKEKNKRKVRGSKGRRRDDCGGDNLRDCFCAGIE